jgi:hypothetical protein
MKNENAMSPREKTSGNTQSQNNARIGKEIPAHPGRPNGVASVVSFTARTKSLAAVTVGLVTYPARMLPSFLIVGAARCGTTSMFLALSQHPAIFGAVLGRKHLNYFDVNYHRGLAWYRSHFRLKLRAGLAGRGAGTEPMAFEATPDYMYHPLAPERISRDLPGVKLLVLVRDPVERAYSQHAYQTIDGYEAEPFERALELEDTRLAGEAERMAADPRYVSYNYQHFGYRARGHYADQLDRLARFFPRERIHVVDSEEFFANPCPVYDQVIEFLGLAHCTYPVFGRHNARPRSPMPNKVRAALDEHFCSHDERLTAWLGCEPSWRRRS